MTEIGGDPDLAESDLSSVTREAGMAGVMYQGYASYLQAYQRHSNPYCPSTTLALNHYDKVPAANITG